MRKKKKKRQSKRLIKDKDDGNWKKLTTKQTEGNLKK